MTTKETIVKAVEDFLTVAKEDAHRWAHAPLDELISFLKESAPIVRNDLVRAAYSSVQVLVPNDGSDVSIAAQQVEAQAVLATAPAVPGEEPTPAPTPKGKKTKAAAPAQAEEATAPAPVPAPAPVVETAPAPAPVEVPAEAKAETPAVDNSNNS